ncbi:MAG TPA: chemotaxis protein CheX [Bacillota bacterium]|nr:chemotaxis protein CheX [Bacillota bacterium]
MKVEFINPFVSAASMVLERLGNQNTEKGKLSLKASPIQGNDVNTIIGVTGDVRGQVLYSMNLDTAMKVAASMMMGMPVTEFDELCKSAVNELGNMITGNAASELSCNGFNCTITPPTLIMGKEVVISIKNIQVLVIPLLTDFGEIDINVALSDDEL